MNRSLTLLLILALGLSLAAGSAAAENARFSFDVSGLLLTRAAGATYPLISLWSHAGQGDIMTTDDVALNSWRLGIDARLGIVLGRIGGEVRAFTLGKWTNSDQARTSAWTIYAIETDPPTNYGMSAGATMTTDNESSLGGFEANVTYDLSPAVLLYGGVRYMTLNETLTMLGDFGGDVETDVWNIENRMIGGQVGLRVNFLSPVDYAAPGFIFGAHGAMGLFSNSAHVDFSVEEYAPANSDEDTSKMSIGIDAGLRFGYRISGSFELFAAYNMLWLNSAAIATDQVRGTTSYNVIPTSTLIFSGLFVHGAKAGFSVRL